MDAITLATIDQRLMEAMGDYLEFTVTTAIAASTSVISTTLKQFDYSTDDFFNNWWLYITDKANAGVERRISDYTSSTGTLTVYGANLTSDVANLATCQLSRYRRTDRVKAINDSLREIYPNLHKRVDNRILITNNYLPNGHFEDQSTSGTPDKWAFTNATGTAETTIIRGGSKSVKVAATAADGYMKLTTANYPRLLDLSGQTVSIRIWVYPEVADDAFITIYTSDKDGTTQTLNSTTTCIAGKYTLISLEDQVLNDDLVDCEIRLRVHTNAKYVYFDDARLISANTQEYLIPEELNDGIIQQVHIQTGGYYKSSLDDVASCDSLFGQYWDECFDWRIVNDGTNKWLRLDSLQFSEKRIRLIGTAPLSALSAATDTITIDQEKIPMLIAYAEYNYYKRHEGIVASEDVARYEKASGKAFAEYMRLSNKRMAMPSKTMRLPQW